MHHQNAPLTYTISAFCQALGIGKTKAYELINCCEVDALRIGGRTLITATSVQALLDRALTQEKAKRA